MLFTSELAKLTSDYMAQKPTTDLKFDSMCTTSASTRQSSGPMPTLDDVSNPQCNATRNGFNIDNLFTGKEDNATTKHLETHNIR